MQFDLVDDVSISISEKIGRLSPSQSEHCIFRVHNQLRMVNEKAYGPEIISIGPYHRGKKTLKMMEEHKLRYFQLLLQQKKDVSIDKYVNAVKNRQQEACKYYAEPARLNDENEVTEMMLLDGCFIIELLRKFDRPYLRGDENDLIFRMDWILCSLQRDFLLFENQLPFIVLRDLFDMIEAPNQHRRLIFLVLRFFRDVLPGLGHTQSTDGNSHDDIKHLLGLIHENWIPSFAGTQLNGVKDSAKNEVKTIPCATELQEAGVKFKKVEEGCLFDIKFKNGIIQIPSLTIEDRTETFLRNLIVYEQYDSDNHLNYVTDYVNFMDGLIDSAKDVEILCRHGIIHNLLGDDEPVSTIFNRISDSVTGPNDPFHYIDIFNRVNIHCNKRRNRWMAKLRRNYLNSPWGLISILAATVLLVLTLTQTVFAILSS